MTSMHLSSMTTLIGTTSLLFAQHPVLFLVGVSLTSGLLTGYLTALFVVPALLTMLRGSPNLPHAVDASAPTHNS
jgi:predicted RND superfamily exporter protein